MPRLRVAALTAGCDRLSANLFAELDNGNKAVAALTFDALKAWEATDPKKTLTPDIKYEFVKGVIPGTSDPAIMTVFHTPLPKALKKPTDASATWVEEHYYETPAADEASSYVLEFRLARA